MTRSLMPVKLSEYELTFGAPVKVLRLIKPVYVERYEDKVVPKVRQPKSAGKIQFELMDERPRLADDYDKAPGEPLPTEIEIQKNHIYRILRRIPVNLEGVVVGKTWRSEGQYHRGGAGRLYDDYDPPYLSEMRRIVVARVAINPNTTDRGAWPERVECVLPEDMELL